MGRVPLTSSASQRPSRGERSAGRAVAAALERYASRGGGLGSSPYPCSERRKWGIKKDPEMRVFLIPRSFMLGVFPPCPRGLKSHFRGEWVAKTQWQLLLDKPLAQPLTNISSIH